MTPRSVPLFGHPAWSIGMAAALLSWPALFNGAPLVFSDSLMYATAAMKWEIPAYFSVFYSFIIWPFHLGLSLWPVVFAQSAALPHLIYLAHRCVMGTRPTNANFILMIGLLALGSSLPWLTSQVLPDVLTSVVVLGTFLLSMCRDSLSRRELIYITVLTTCAISTHLSHIPVAIAALCICALLRFQQHRGQWGSWAARVTAPTIAATLALLGVTWFSSHQFALARDSNVFTLAKLLHEGPAISYLEAACPDIGYRLCVELTEIKGRSHDELKWGDWSPFRKIDPVVLEQEAHDIVRATVAAYPWQVFVNALNGASRQFLKFQTGDGLSPQYASLVAEHVGQLFGESAQTALIESRQGRGTLPLIQIRIVHTVALLIAGAFILVGLIWFDMSDRVRQFLLFVTGALVCNAIVTGALSGPYDRYLARVTWLVCFAAIVGAIDRLAYISRHSPNDHGSAPRDLGHLEDDVAAMAHDLGADLDKHFPQRRQPRMHV